MSTEISVGLPFLKCSTNPSQTVNAKTNKKSKTAVTKKIALEAFERFGNDPDINKDESKNNIYLTDIHSTEEYLELIEQTKEKINNQLTNANKKKLRKDTVDTIALVVKPSYESMQLLSYEKQVQFLKDSKNVIEDIFRQYINPNFKFDALVMHFDELNPHLHCLGMPLVIDEKTNMETFNAKKFVSLKNITSLNKNYSKKMQELGWNVKDFNIYEEMSVEEKENYKKQKKEYGKSSLEYKNDKLKELENQISNKQLIKEELKRDLECETRKELQEQIYNDSMKMIEDIKEDIIKNELGKEETKIRINNEVKKKINEQFEKTSQRYDYDETLKHYKDSNDFKEKYIQSLHSVIATIQKMTKPIPIIGKIVDKLINSFTIKEDVDYIYYNSQNNEVLKSYDMLEEKDEIFSREEQDKMNEILEDYELLNYDMEEE